MFPLRDMIRNRLRTMPWWAILLLGIASIVLGLLLVLSPKTTAMDVMRVVGVLAMIGGAVSIIRIPWDRRVWGWKLSGGAMAIVLGFAIRTAPLESAYLVSAIIFWTMGVGVLVAGAIGLIVGIGLMEIGYIIVGALALVFGIFLVFTAVIGSVAIPSLIGIVGFLGGMLIIGAAFQRRSQAPYRASNAQPYLAQVEPNAGTGYQRQA
jgi:uncharacterized membrane protein HdeD (DUF308 family)